jgi:hypothetical protein
MQHIWLVIRDDRREWFRGVPREQQWQSYLCIALQWHMRQGYYSYGRSPELLLSCNHYMKDYCRLVRWGR